MWYRNRKKAEVKSKDFKSLITKDISTLANIFRSEGHEIRIVGGAVRDAALGKEAKDIDFATTATPDEMIALCKKYDLNYIETGLDHGTITVVINKEPYEITTLRADVDANGRHAVTVPVKKIAPEADTETWWKMDSERRDLTMNAMSYDPLEDNVYDYHNGLEDIREGVVDFVGDPSDRMKEDYLRILRYFRFLGRIEQPKIKESIAEAISNTAEGLQNISAERIWMEMQKILTGGNSAHILSEMKKLGVDRAIGVPFIDPDGAARVADLGGSAPAVFAKLVGKENALELGTSLKMNNDEKDVLKYIKQYYSGDDFETVLVQSSRPDFERRLLREALLFDEKPEQSRSLENWSMPEFPVTGADLIALGVKPGPELGAILKTLRSQWQDSGYAASKEDLLSEINI